MSQHRMLCTVRKQMAKRELLEYEVLVEYHDSLKVEIQEPIEHVIRKFHEGLGKIISGDIRDRLLQEADKSTSNAAESLLRELENATKNDTNVFFGVVSILRSASVLYSITKLGCQVTNVTDAYWHRERLNKSRRKSAHSANRSDPQLSPKTKAKTHTPLTPDSPSKSKNSTDNSPKHFKALASAADTDQEILSDEKTAIKSVGEILDPVQEQAHTLVVPFQESESPFPIDGQARDPGASIQAAGDEESQSLRRLRENFTKALSEVSNFEERLKKKQMLEKQLVAMKEFYEEKYKQCKVEQDHLQRDLDVANVDHAKEVTQLKQRHKKEMEEKSEVTSMEYSRKQAQQHQQIQLELDGLQRQLSEKEKECKSLQEKLADTERQRDEIKGEISAKEGQLGIMTLKRNLQQSNDWKHKIGMCQEIQDLARQICDGLLPEQIKELSRQMEDKIKLLQKRRTSQSWPRNKN